MSGVVRSDRRSCASHAHPPASVAMIYAADHVRVASTLTGGRASVVGLNRNAGCNAASSNNASSNNANNNRPPPRVGD